MYSCRLPWWPHSLPSPFLCNYRPLGHNSTVPRHAFHTFCSSLSKGTNLPPRPKLPDHEIKETYLKGSGPGGQKINKTNSAAQLTHIPTGIVVKCQATRSRSQNYTIARRLLAEKVELLCKGDESRTVKVAERKSKKKRSADKKKRRKYRQLAEQKDGQENEIDEIDDDDGEEQDDEEAEDSLVEEVEGGRLNEPKSDKASGPPK